MADSVVRRGRDTHVNSNKPDKEYAQAKHPRMTSGSHKVYVYLPAPGLRGRTVESATLSVPVFNTWTAHNVTATPAAEAWGPRKTTWNNQPALRTGGITAAQASRVDGERIEVDVTAHLQAVANGAKHYGWCITTNSADPDRVHGFNSDMNSWVLRYSLVEAPDAPTVLSPNGGLVGVRPVLTCDFTDLGGESTEMAALQVKVNTTASTSGAWDSGEVASTLPEFDLAASAWPAPTSGLTYYWQVRVKDGAGYWSEWSDWASFQYVPKPTLTVTNPAAGLVWDPTPTIAANISAGTIKAWRIRISKGSDKSRVLYDSGKQPGTGSSSLAHTVPLKSEGRRILKDDKNYWLNVRVWDNNNREATPGDPTYTGTWVSFRMDDDATGPPPDSLVAVQIGESPRVRLTWTRATGVAEGWVIRRDSEVIARLDVDEVEVTGTQFSWIDDTASPWVDHTYKVKAIDGSKQTPPSPGAHVTPEVEGMWLLGADTEVVMAGDQVGDFRTLDRRATYQPLNQPYDVDIVHAFEGVVGSFAGSIDDRGPASWTAARAVLMEMKANPHEAVQLVYATTSVPVLLRNVSVSPSPSIQPGSLEHDVTFDVQQIGDFEVSV